MFKNIIPYGIRKVFSILLAIPFKLYLLLQALNPLTWIRLSRKIHEKQLELKKENEGKVDSDTYDSLRPPPPTDKEEGAWHLKEEKRIAIAERIQLGQRLMLLLFLVIPSLFALTLLKGWGSSTFSTPLLVFNFFILILMIMVPTYLRLIVIRGQLDLKRLVGFNDLKKSVYWW